MLFFTLIVMSLFFGFLRAVPSQGESLFPACAEKCGYINQLGHMEIQPQYDEARDFRCGLAAVRVGANWGFIDGTGAYKIGPRFPYVGDFSDDLAVVKDGSGLFGFIDKAGEFVVTPKFEVASDFAGGKAFVKLRGKSGLIDKSGDMSLEARFDFIEPFSSGLAVAAKKFTDGSIRVAHIDVEGNQLQPQWLTYAGRFSEDIAVISTDPKISPGVSRYGLIFDSADLKNQISPEIAYQVIDRTGRLTFARSAASFGDFHEGLVAVCEKWKCGYLNKQGSIAIPFRYDFAGDFHDGLAQVKVGSSNLVIDRQGNEVFKVQTTITQPFSNGLAPFVKCKDKECEVGYVDKTGKAVWTGRTKVADY